MTEENPHPTLSLGKGEAGDGAERVQCRCYSAIIHVSSPAVGLTREAGY